MITSKTKAWLSSILALIIAVLCFVACSNEADEGVKVPPSNPPQAQIITELQEFNNSLVVMPESRKIGWIGWLSVGIADAGGAYMGSRIGGAIGAFGGPIASGIGAGFGGVILGAATSLAQYKMAVAISEFDPFYSNNKTSSSIKKDSFGAAYIICKNNIQKSDYNIGNYFEFDSCATLVGILHNRILDSVEDIELKNNQANYLTKFSPLEKKIFEDEVFNESFKNITLRPKERLDTTNTANAVMQLFMDVVEEKCQNYSSLVKIINNYKRTVEKSTELSAEEKQNLYNGFSVMAYSFNYWSIRWPYTKVD